ncbi:MAG TPA: anthranilate synthase component I [Chloroflexota bacterium]|nr:anthranilate synthase component I [Chloroflexota bacterium]
MTVVLGELTPSLRDLRSRSLDGRSVAVSREILADLDTPVSAYLKLRAEGGSFLLESAEGGERIGRYSFVGTRPRRTVRVKDRRQRWVTGDESACDDPLAAARAIVEAYSPVDRSRAPFEGGALGYLSYEAARYFERIPSAAADPLDLPDAAFMDVDTVLIFDHIARRTRVVSHVRLDQPLDRAYREAEERIEEVLCRLNRPVAGAPDPPSGVPAPRSNLDPRRFQDMVLAGKEHIAAGDILQVVLSQRLAIPLPSDAFGLYRRLRTVSPAPYMYYLDFGDHQIVGASPELLVEARDGAVFTRPIAGTRPRGRTEAEDARLAEELLADEKERAEHLMLVDLARNDVGRVSAPGTVSVRDFMKVERFSHVMHLVTDVSGTLDAGRTAYDALRAAFPAGTVSGAPKIRAMEIIAELEPDRRGPYAGAVGFINTGGEMEMAITIRTGVVKNGTLFLQVGAGIVADSDPERELGETMNKARALLAAAGVTL